MKSNSQSGSDHRINMVHMPKNEFCEKSLEHSGCMWVGSKDDFFVDQYLNKCKWLPACPMYHWKAEILLYPMVSISQNHQNNGFDGFAHAPFFNDLYLKIMQGWKFEVFIWPVISDIQWQRICVAQRNSWWKWWYLFNRYIERQIAKNCWGSHQGNCASLSEFCYVWKRSNQFCPMWQELSHWFCKLFAWSWVLRHRNKLFWRA